MKTKIYVQVILISILYSCSNQEPPQKYFNLSKEYYTKDSLYSLDLIEKSDSLVGKHCFTAYQGSKIDCCLEFQSILLKKQSDYNYIGIMKSCYDDTIHNISISFKNSELIFMISDYHVFLEKNKKVVFH